MAAARVTVFEVGPRDGLQNEPEVLDVEVRVELVRRLAAAGLPGIEVASFVDPRRVPQMAGAEEVVAAVGPLEGVVRAGLALNERGYDRLLATGLDEVRFAFGVTESFNERNQGASVEDSLAAARRIVARARDDGIRSAVTLSVAFGCPFEGEVDPARVLEIAGTGRRGRAGHAAPRGHDRRRRTASGARADRRRRELGRPVGGHFHNTRNTGYANALAALEAGASVLDASIGGLGGCPFAPERDGQHRHRGPPLPARSARGSRPASTSACSSRRASGSPGCSDGGWRGSCIAQGDRVGPDPWGQTAGVAGRIVPRTSPSSTLSGAAAQDDLVVVLQERPRRPVAEPDRMLAVRGELDERPLAAVVGPEIVPDAKTSPVRIDAPLTVACASCCGIVQ